MNFTSTLKPKLIYVFRINDATHRGCLKIGETTCKDANALGAPPNSKLLNESAKKRINEYTQTAGIAYELLYTELTVYISNGKICSFNDNEVHNVLERSGIKRKVFDTVNKANEWFITDLETAKRAIQAVKEGRKSIKMSEISCEISPIIFRPEQVDAIEKTKKQFIKGNRMLWNAKMRFGKTLSALQVVKDMQFSRTLILTHRPVVDKGWFEDFHKIFYDDDRYDYGSKHNGDSYVSLEEGAKNDSLKYVYFVSMQDLRGSELVGGNFTKNDNIFDTSWDCIIVDEAHEGTQTELGKAVLGELIDKNTKVLRLSGTPFNLLDDFKENEIYTWDYVMEQRAKAEWDFLHKGDHNPYSSLPTMHIYTYDLGRLLTQFIDEDIAFNFKEFFRVDCNGLFIHEQDVIAFLDLLSNDDEDSYYPFANSEYRNIFRHTLWMLPGVKEAKALSTLLQKHHVFQYFNIINVAGEGDENEENKNALVAVEEAIGKNPDETRTITLSCGRLTTGVSVKAWTGVFMLSGSYNTGASSYMQTIFRVQTPATINGKVKENCYVFDFAPDRTLKVIAETAKISAKAGKTSDDDRTIIGEFLNFCPIIGIEGSVMKNYDVPKMLEQLKKVYIERVVQHGFEDNSLYNDKLLKLNEVELKEFEDLKKTIGNTKAMPKTDRIDINNQGFNNEQYEELDNLEKKSRKKKQELTEKEKKRLEELKKKKKNREAAISILRGISIRMPLMIYGAELEDETKEITIDNFTSLIDPKSWEEFMPKGVSKHKFNSIKKYYDPEIFSAAGKRIRAMARAADRLSIEERIERITNIFDTFRNPDKETVLTPWRVVNMHLSDCIGGYKFYEDDNERKLSEPKFIDKGKVTSNVFSEDSRVLEINSKSGLYPLYMTYGIYRTRVASLLTAPDTIEEDIAVWDTTLRDNIFIICKTKMAAAITRRTLLGFRKGKVNTHTFDDLINQIKNKPDALISNISRSGFWKIKRNYTMKFNAIVGNPPYQVMDGGGAGTSAITIYNSFVSIAKNINPDYISMIMPARWYAGGKGLDKFRESMLTDKRFMVMMDYPNPKDCFPTSNISGGICYFLWNKIYNGKCYFTNVVNGIYTSLFRNLNEYDVFIRYNNAVPIINKVISESFSSMSSIVYARNPFNLDSSVRGLQEKTQYNNIAVYTSKGLGYINESEIQSNIDLLSYYKVLMGKVLSGHIGETDINGQVKVIATLQVAQENEVATDSYLVIGKYSKLRYSNHLFLYLKSKFLRFLLLQSLVSMNISRRNFRFVPLQDFTEKSDIDWNKSVAEIDRQLYKKYNLTDDEITFIENTIKPM